jgi:hypothetical protein
MRRVPGNYRAQPRLHCGSHREGSFLSLTYEAADSSSGAPLNFARSPSRLFKRVICRDYSSVLWSEKNRDLTFPGGWSLGDSG